jgi:hypothetical protein
MYFMLHCFSPPNADNAMLSYKPDDPLRSWAEGARFDDPPPEPVRAEVKRGYAGNMAEFWDDPVPLMTKRLLAALRGAGVDNLDTYKAVIVDPASKKEYPDYVAFNIVGTIAAADLKKSKMDPNNPTRMIAADFDSVTIDPKAPRGALMFRLAESVNAIVVHEKVKRAIEASGITTLTFVAPEDWAG